MKRPCAKCGRLFTGSQLKRCGPAGEWCHECYDADVQRLIAEARKETP